MTLSDKLSAIRNRVIQKFSIYSINKKFQKGEYEFVSTVCPLCQSSLRTKIAEKDRYSLSIGLWLCQDCGMVYQHPRLNNSSLQKFYARDYRRLYRGSNKITSSYIERGWRRGKAIEEFLKKYNFHIGRNILEIGCGPGGILLYFAEQGYSVMGTEWDENCVKFGQDQGIPVISGGIEEVAASQRRFNLIILNHLLEHLYDPLGFLKCLKNLFSPEGLIYIEVPGIRNPATLSRFDETIQIAHLVYFDAVTLNELLIKSGYVSKFIDETCRFIGTPEGDTGIENNNHILLSENAKRNLELLSKKFI
jgi:SAM-dependent methyltransferase